MSVGHVINNKQGQFLGITTALIDLEQEVKLMEALKNGKFRSWPHDLMIAVLICISIIACQLLP